MQTHEIPSFKNKRKKRIGRGGKRGTYSGRGQKGQKSRSGRKLPGGALAVVRTIPKLRGAGQAVFSHKPVILKTGALGALGAEITVRLLREKRVIKANNSAKILVGGGPLNAKISVVGIPVSRGAKEAVEKAGGSVK